MEPDFEDIQLAREKSKEAVLPSPLIHSHELSRMFGAQIYLKLENLQETGSFKIRGAFNRLSQLTEEERRRGVIAASAGNHAQGVAWTCARLGIKASIVMPEEVSIRKLLAVRDYGAEVILYGAYFDDAYSRAREISKQTGKVFVPPFDDVRVIAGQGAIGLEILDVLDEETAVVVPVGGGGLISGIAIATKAARPRARVIGVQTQSCPSALRSLERGEPVSVEVVPTLADGIAVKRPGDLTFPIMRDLVDDVLEVDEEAIAGAIVTLMERVNVVAEGAGATPLAAVMEHGERIGTKRYVLVISGGNIETNMIDRILQRGSIRMGRLLRVEVSLLDVPGSLARLLDVVAKERANILHIVHDRLALDHPIQVSRVELSLETRGPDHAREIFDALNRSGYEFRQIHSDPVIR